MPGPLTVSDGALVLKDPSDVPVFQFDWDTRHLADGVTIATSTFTITAIRPAADTALTKDQEAIDAGSRTTHLRLTGGTVGATYRIDNRIVTDESPAQTVERSFFVKIAER